MLCIDREGPKHGKPGESLTIDHGGETLTLYISKVIGDRVKLAIDAPHSFQISRPDAVKQERKHANG